MRKKKFNENYFENIDSEDKAYFLGLIYADGCIINDSKNFRYRLVLKLHKKDTHILEDLINCIESENSVWTHGKRDMCEVGFSGKKIINDLELIGLIQNKTFKLEYPTIRENLERHFLRGYFDGDGCIRISFDKRDNSERGDLRIVGGSIKFLDKMNERMNYLFGVNTNKLYGPKNKEYKFIGWAGMTDIEKIYDGFYCDSNLFLQRKKIIFDDVITKIRNKKKYRKK
jgi:hypothetical protein